MADDSDLYEAHGYISSDPTRELPTSRAVQREHAQKGDYISRKQALDEVRTTRLDAINKATKEAKPNFLKDGNGIRGPQNPVTNLQADGMNGRGNQLQVAGDRGDPTTPSQNIAPAITVVYLDVQGQPGIMGVPGQNPTIIPV